MAIRVHILLIVILEFIVALNIISEAFSFNESITNEAVLSNETKAFKDLNTSELIAKYGYIAKDYYVTTEDGYILTVTRMENAGKVVLLTHGMVDTAKFWLTLGLDSLPFILFDAGYDVYIINTRGSKYSKHSYLTPKDKEYWNYSFHEIGYYDLPALIDFALETSQQSQLAYIGHSQGTVVFFVMASLRPEYNSKVSLMISMSTIAWIHNANAPVLRMLKSVQNLENHMTMLGIYRLMPQNDYLEHIFKDVCPRNRFTMMLCASTLFMCFGFDYYQLNFTQFLDQISQYKPETSTKNVLHYAQIRESEDFRQYDYKFANVEKYGIEIPPSYPVEKITAPIAIMHSENDWLSPYKDVEILTKKLPNVVEFYRVPFHSFNHIDYIWGKDAKKLVYDKVLLLLKKHCKI